MFLLLYIGGVLTNVDDWWREYYAVRKACLAFPNFTVLHQLLIVLIE